MNGKALLKISCGLYVLGVKNGNNYGGSLVDAFIQATSCHPPHAILCSMNGNNTTSLILEHGDFTVSVLPRDINPFVLADFGFQSSRDTDKWQYVPYELFNNLPVLRDCAAHYYCKLDDVRVTATHHILTCTVEDAELGNGDPLLYTEYQNSLKPAVAAAFREFKQTGVPPGFLPSTAPKTNETTEKAESSWVCTLCGYVYDGQTPFEDLPDTWTCPLCGASKEYFERQPV